MRQLAQLLKEHYDNHPGMEIRDAVKFIYQHFMGPGHLITDEDACLRRLLAEYAATPQSPDLPLREDIGNGFCRVNLAALDAHGCSPEQLSRDFIRSAATVHGTMDQFRQRLSLLADLTAAGRMPFSPDALSAYLAEYEQAGFPPVSHSEAYRSMYHPAYRVLKAFPFGEGGSPQG